MNGPASTTSVLDIEVAFDLICPWCLIGKRQLDAALAQLRARRPGIATRLRWLSLPLLPELPWSGVPFREFYLRRLGGPEALAARQAQVRRAGLAAGVDLEFDAIPVMPNTLIAHRVVNELADRYAADRVGHLIDALFDLHFRRGANIGDAKVVTHAAEECGFDVAAPVPDESSTLMAAQQREVLYRRGVRGVPQVIIDGWVLPAGTHGKRDLLQALLFACDASPRPV